MWNDRKTANDFRNGNIDLNRFTIFKRRNNKKKNGKRAYSQTPPRILCKCAIRWLINFIALKLRFNVSLHKSCVSSNLCASLSCVSLVIHIPSHDILCSHNAMHTDNALNHNEENETKKSVLLATFFFLLSFILSNNMLLHANKWRMRLSTLKFNLRLRFMKKERTEKRTPLRFYARDFFELKCVFWKIAKLFFIFSFRNTWNGNTHIRRPIVLWFNIFIISILNRDWSWRKSQTCWCCCFIFFCMNIWFQHFIIFTAATKKMCVAWHWVHVMTLHKHVFNRFIVFIKLSLAARVQLTIKKKKKETAAATTTTKNKHLTQNMLCLSN